MFSIPEICTSETPNLILKDENVLLSAYFHVAHYLSVDITVIMLMMLPEQVNFQSLG